MKEIPVGRIVGDSVGAAVGGVVGDSVDNSFTLRFEPRSKNHALEPQGIVYGIRQTLLPHSFGLMRRRQ